MKLILVFGSLRRDSKRGYNFGRCGPQKFIRALTLQGYDLYSLGAYPAICPGNGTIHCELHEVNEDTFRHIEGMEHGAGYSSHTIDLPEGPATIYLYPEEYLKSQDKVKSGNWD